MTRILVPVVASSVAAAVVGLVLAGSNGSSGDAGAAATAGTPSVASSSFALLRSGQPAAKQNPLADSGVVSAQGGVDAAGVRQTTTGDAWVTRTNSGLVCLAARRSLDTGVIALSCAAEKGVSSDGLFMGGSAAPSSANAGQNELVGLVPDGVSAVTFTVDGKPITVDAKENLVRLTTPQKVTTARFSDANGAQHVADIQGAGA